MKKSLSIIFAALLMLGIGTDASAQGGLGSLKNAVKKAAEKAVSTAVESQKSSNETKPDSKETSSSSPEDSRSKAPMTALEALQASAPVQKAAEVVNRLPEHKVPCPSFMAKDDEWDHAMVRNYIERIGYISNSDLVKATSDSLAARAREDSLEIERLKPHRLQMSLKEDMAFDELENELKRYHTFLTCLGDYTTRLYFSGNVNVSTGSATIDYISVRVNRTTVYTKCDSTDDNWYFYSISNDKTFLEDEDLDLVKADFRRYYYITNFLLAGQKEREFQEVSLKADYASRILLNAIEHNSVDNIEFHPYPKGGPLNGLAGKALASAKQSESYADAIAVVIDDQSWTIDFNALGSPVRRKAGGWVIKNTKYGKKAYRAQFAEDYMGGGSYGEIKLYGIGGDQHFVK